MDPLDQEIAISVLQSTGNFKVLRRLYLDDDTPMTRCRIPAAPLGQSQIAGGAQRD